ncbi:hypothetical protein ACEQ8H_002353 [Pleosporales sp. CAS-2024a]
MATALLPARGIALVGAPDSDMECRDAHPPPLQAMQVEMTQEIVDELVQSVRSGKAPQIFFGKTPQLKYGDKTHVLQSTPESHAYELYKSSGAGDGARLEFAGLIHHSLRVQKADHVTAGVDSALQQLRSSMAAISEFKEANKTIVGDATASRTPGHRRFASTGFKAQHLAPGKLGSPLLSAPSSPAHQRPPTSQPASSHHAAVLHALRVPVLHLLARQPATEAALAATCRASQASIRELLRTMARRLSADADKWQLTDKAFRDINPFQFPYPSAADREQAIDGAIKAFDRQRLAKDDKLWQMLLPPAERGQGKCLSRSKVKAPEAKPKASTPLHKIADLAKKKPAEKKARAAREPEAKPKQAAKERPLVKDVKYEPKKAAPAAAAAPAARPTAPAARYTPSSTDAATATARAKKAPAAHSSTALRAKPKPAGRDQHRDRLARPGKPAMPFNTKPKNPSPLSASPPVNASDFEDSHPVHKALAAAASPAKSATASAPPSLKRKANDTDSDMHSHSLPVKRPQFDRATPNHAPAPPPACLPGSASASGDSLKRKADDSSSSDTPPTAPKARKLDNIDTGIASRYHNNNNNNNNAQASPCASSSSTTSPTIPSLSFRQTVELSQRFQKYYKKYEELYWQLTESDKSPTETQRNDLLKMHKKLEEMKREIKHGAGVHR